MIFGWPVEKCCVLQLSVPRPSHQPAAPHGPRGPGASRGNHQLHRWELAAITAHPDIPRVLRTTSFTDSAFKPSQLHVYCNSSSQRNLHMQRLKQRRFEPDRAAGPGGEMYVIYCCIFNSLLLQFHSQSLWWMFDAGVLHKQEVQALQQQRIEVQLRWLGRIIV